MSTATILIGTRASLLARTQAGQVAEALTSGLGAEVELVDITTSGDVSSAPLAVIGGTGVFVSALRDALLAGQVTRADSVARADRTRPDRSNDGGERA